MFVHPASRTTVETATSHRTREPTTYLIIVVTAVTEGIVGIEPTELQHRRAS